MRYFVIILVCSTIAYTQAQPSSPTAQVPASAPAKPAEQLVIASGTKVALSLKHAISTSQSHEGDAVYAETTFPVVANDRVLIPAGTFVQGRISHIQRAGRVKGRAEVLIHFTTMIYPSGYTVMLPGAVENAPGVDKTRVKDGEGTIRADSQTGQKIGQVAAPAATGAIIGAATNGGKGALIGGGIGGAVGTAIALLTRGNDVKLDAGTTLEMIIQRDVPVDASRVPPVTRTAANQ